MPKHFYKYRRIIFTNTLRSSKSMNLNVLPKVREFNLNFENNFLIFFNKYYKKYVIMSKLNLCHTEILICKTEEQGIQLCD